MKPRLLSRILMPHGGRFTINHPMRPSIELMGTHFEMLWNSYVNYNKANSIPIGLDDEELIEAKVCERYPNECENNKRALGISTVAPGLWDVVRGSTVMMMHKAHGSQLVSQDEANRRAQICQNCPLRAQMTLPCSRCTSHLENVVSIITGSHHTPFDDPLMACSICKCLISASVWLPLETQCIGVTDDMRDKFVLAKECFHCWKVCSN